MYLEKNETCLSNTFLLLKTCKVIIFLGVASFFKMSEYVTIRGLLNAGQRTKKSYLIVKKKELYNINSISGRISSNFLSCPSMYVVIIM